MKQKKSFPSNLSKTLGISFLALLIVVLSTYFFYVKPRYVVPILMYHSVSDVVNEGYPQVTPKTFDRQMKFLRDAKYSVITLQELIDGITAGKKFNRKTVVITFDDGYKDNYVHAFPVLAKYDIPATIFIIPSEVGVRGDFFNWDQARIMSKNGIKFGAHGWKHLYLTSVETEEELTKEVTLCKKEIEDKLGTKVTCFSYPLGAFNEEVKEAVQKAGYKGAVTTNRGQDRFNRDVWQLNRIKTSEKDGTVPFHFRAVLSGYYNFFRGLKTPE